MADRFYEEREWIEILTIVIQLGNTIHLRQTECHLLMFFTVYMLYICIHIPYQTLHYWHACVPHQKSCNCLGRLWFVWPVIVQYEGKQFLVGLACHCAV